MSKSSKNKKTAIVLFNLGGPDSKSSVKPFLFNLFNDKYIITLPKFLRYLVACLISSRREKTAQEIYAHLGDKSPILEETKAQADSLEKSLRTSSDVDYKVFICMRHWHPMSNEVVKDIVAYNPDEVILLPLYPQFSTTTTLSSIEDFSDKIRNILPNILYKTICCYPKDKTFIQSHVDLISQAMEKINDKNNCRILFSAHGLPKKIIESGDPYQWQVENTVQSIIEELPFSQIDYKISYQSRVGPLEWIGPNTEEEIEKAGKEQKELMVVPVAFVSEHSETLVELDIEYKAIADKHSINYVRVPTLSINNYFVESLKNMVTNATNSESNFLYSNEMKRLCPASYSKCPCKD
ncbi:MAG: ferrochelatase [Rickettsiaceae bacterium]|nr:ferrochelatase [Rickettsiaceae bacterium]